MRLCRESADASHSLDSLIIDHDSLDSIAHSAAAAGRAAASKQGPTASSFSPTMADGPHHASLFGIIQQLQEQHHVIEDSRKKLEAERTAVQQQVAEGLERETELRARIQQLSLAVVAGSSISSGSVDGEEEGGQEDRVAVAEAEAAAAAEQLAQLVAEVESTRRLVVDLQNQTTLAAERVQSTIPSIWTAAAARAEEIGRAIPTEENKIREMSLRMEELEKQLQREQQRRDDSQQELKDAEAVQNGAKASEARCVRYVCMCRRRSLAAATAAADRMSATRLHCLRVLSSAHATRCRSLSLPMGARRHCCRA
jgi:hemerythrin-like domain-containing protein